MHSVAWDPKNPHQLKLAIIYMLLRIVALHVVLIRIDSTQFTCLECSGCLGARTHSYPVQYSISLGFIPEPHRDATEVADIPGGNGNGSPSYWWLGRELALVTLLTRQTGKHTQHSSMCPCTFFSLCLR